MCVIAYGSASSFVISDLELCDQRNGAGIGLAWKDNKLRFMRGIDLKQLIFMLSHFDRTTKVCVHFRRTETKPKPYLTHPFPFERSLTIMSGEDKPLFFHNGTLTNEELTHVAKVVNYPETQLERDIEAYGMGLSSNTEIFSKLIAGKHFDAVDFAIRSMLISGNKSRIAVWMPDKDEPVFYNQHKFFRRGEMLYSNYRSVRRDLPVQASLTN